MRGRSFFGNCKSCLEAPREEAKKRRQRSFSFVEKYLGDPNVELTKIAEAYGLKGEKVKTASEMPGALQRSLKTMRDGKAVVLDIEIGPDGPALNQPTWYQRYSLADVRRKRLNA